MNIIFAGTPQFAAEHLKSLLASHHNIKCILTQPDRGSGRGKKIKPSPVKEIGLESGVRILQPSSLKDENTINILNSLEADLMIVVAYGLLVPKEILDIPKLGCMNVHASILPKWRGASPIEYSLYSEDKETGITFMRMSEGLDEGPILEVHKCNIDSKDNLGALEKKLTDLGKAKLIEFLEKFEKGEIKEKPQDDSYATFAPKITQAFQQIDWKLPSEIINRKIKSLDPKYGAFTFLKNKRVKIYKGSPTHNLLKLNPGRVDIANGKELIVGCGQGTALKIEEIQMEGKGIIQSDEFVRGYQLLIKQELKFNSGER
tara:strand:+ start:4085 stop:5035 length:951 start_codon:yes stop_codon:yes gene_type:complete